MREAALPATVVVLRRRGVRIPAAELLRHEPPSGLLVATQHTRPKWHICLYRDEKFDGQALPALLLAQLERENDGVRLYGGIEVDRHQEWRQAWLCAPTPARAREILLAMLEQEGGEV